MKKLILILIICLIANKAYPVGKLVNAAFNKQSNYSSIYPSEKMEIVACISTIHAYIMNPNVSCVNGGVFLEIQNTNPTVDSFDVDIYSWATFTVVQSHYGTKDLVHQFNNLQPGNYKIRLYEFTNNCSTCYCSIEQDFTIGQPTQVFFNANVSTQDPSVQGCSNGSISVNINSNINDPLFQNFWTTAWQSGYSAFLYDSSWNYISHNPFVINTSFANLAPGKYHIIVSGVRFDAPTCPVVKVFQNIVINPAPCFTLTTSATGVSNMYCDDGTITACIDLYSNECNTFIYIRDSLNNIVDAWDFLSNGPCPVTFSGLPAGNYLVEASGSACTITQNVTVTDGPCNFSAQDFTITQIAGVHGCNNNQLVIIYDGNACGNFSFTCTNTNAPYNSEPCTFNNNTNQYETLADLPPGNYIIHGNNGICTDSVSYIVNDPACAISVTATGSSDVTCSGNVAGTITDFCPPVQVELRRTSDNAFIGTVTSNDGNFVLNLLKNGNYTVTVTDYSGCTTNTLASVTNVFCPVPTTLGFSQIGTQKKVNIFWDEISCATGYTLQFRLIGLTTWTSFNLTGATSNSKIISGLNYGQVYEYRVRTKCTPTLNSAYSAIQTFCIGGGCAARTTATSNDSNDFEMTIYPNPATDVINIDFDVILENPIDIYVYNQLGSKLLVKNSMSTDGLQLDVSSLNNGLYFIAAMVDGKKHTARFVINK